MHGGGCRSNCDGCIPDSEVGPPEKPSIFLNTQLRGKLVTEPTLTGSPSSTAVSVGVHTKGHSRGRGLLPQWVMAVVDTELTFGGVQV